ncbi:Exportin-5 [Entophlyctis sp. JEL0112]|nr:Exportin-5 [Entophlyctis sp. JEL0112]
MDDIIYLSHSSFEAKKVEIAIRLENVVEVIEICLKSIIQKEKTDLLHEKLRRFFADLLTLETNNITLLRCILGICTCFASTLDDDDLLLKFVEKLFALVTFVLPGEEVARGNLGEDTRNLRMKAASILVKLAGALPNRLTPHFNQLVAVIQSRIKIGIVLQFERAKLIEFIIALVHGCDGPDPDEKLRMFSMIISSEVAEWEAAFSSGGAFSCAFNNGEELLQTLGVSTQNLPLSESERIDQWRFKERSLVNLSLRTWMSWMKRTLPIKNGEDLWGPFFGKIFPYVLRIIRVVNYASGSSIWASALLGEDFHLQVKSDSVRGKKDRSFVEATRLWLFNIRDTTFQLVGTMSSFVNAFYNYPDLKDLISSNIFAGASQFDNAHWKLAIQAVLRPLLLHCPSYSVQTIFGAILPAIAQLTFKLEIEWSNMSSNLQEIRSEQEVDDVACEEIASEKLLRDLTRSFADLLFAISYDNTIKNKGLPIIDQSLSNFMISDMSILAAVFGSILKVMRMKDSVASRRAVSACSKNVGFWLNSRRDDIQRFLGDHVMKTCLEVFHDGYFQESHNEVANLITEIYLGLRAVGDVTAYNTLSSLPGINSQMLQQFDDKVSLAGNSKKEQVVAMKSFLKDIKGVRLRVWRMALTALLDAQASVSEAFKQFDVRASSVPSRLNRNKKSRDVFEAAGDDVQPLL